MAFRKDIDIEYLSRIFFLFSKMVGSLAEQSDHFNEIKKLINYLYPATNWSILRLDKTTNQLFFTVIEGEVSHLLKPIPVKVGEGICGQVALTGIPKVITTPSEIPLFTQTIDEATGFKTNSIIAVPILQQNKVIGVFELVNVQDPEQFKDILQVNLLQIIANLAGIFFSISNNQKEIIDTSERDTLTGIYNRFFLDKFILNKKKASGQKNKENNLLIIMIDLNNFKEINDTYGHLIGDSLLKEAAHQLSKKFRKDDLIVRYGGDEFIVVINLKKYNATIDVEQITINKLNEISLSLPYSCTLSYGVSHGNKENFYTALDLADQRMYANKRQQESLGSDVGI